MKLLAGVPWFASGSTAEYLTIAGRGKMIRLRSINQSLVVHVRSPSEYEGDTPDTRPAPVR